MKRSIFIKGVEKLVNPVDVGSIHFIQYFNNYIPKFIQKRMVASSGQKTPYMGFVVEPYSYFLCYELTDLEKTRAMLPKGYRLIKSSIFKNDEPRYYAIFGCFSAHTSGFWGSRVEFYVIAENIETGMLTWIIMDYDTNTITYDPKKVLSDANAEGSLITTDYTGTLYVDFCSDDHRSLKFQSDLKTGSNKRLDQRLWVEGNLSIDYGPLKSDGKQVPFSLKFKPGEFKEALEMPLKAITIERNDWYRDIIGDTPKALVCFPYAQHFLSDSPGNKTAIKNKKALKAFIDSLDMDGLEVFSTKSIKQSFVIGAIATTLIHLLLNLRIWSLKRKLKGK